MTAPWYTPTPAAAWLWPVGGAEYHPEAAPLTTGPGPMLALLREDLGELQAISQYEAHAARATDPRIRALLLHIARDEREHVVELMRAIVALDRQQALAFAQPPHGQGMTLDP